MTAVLWFLSGTMAGAAAMVLVFSLFSIAREMAE